MDAWLDAKAAAKWIGRSPRTIRLWRSQGMPTIIEGGKHLVELNVLQAWCREKFSSDPAHYYRMRRAARDDGRPDPPRPARQAVPETARRPKRPPGGDRGTEPHEGAQRPYEPLDTMRPMRGGPEYWQLHEALRTARPACAGVDAFTADHLTPAVKRELAEICASCAVVDLCREFAEIARPETGVWAGEVWRQRATATT